MKAIWIVSLVLGLGVLSCGQASTNPVKDIRALVVDTLGEDLSLVTADTPPKVHKAAVMVGKSPNQVLIRGTEAIVLNSKSNSIGIIDMNRWTVVREYSLGDGCSPYLMALSDAGYLVVTCNQTNEVLKVDPEAALSANPVLARLAVPGGADLQPTDPAKPGYGRPQGVVIEGHKAYVTLSNLGDDWMPAGPGMVLVVDLAAWVNGKLIQTAKTNPGYIFQPLQATGKLYVTTVGSFDGHGMVEVLDTSADAFTSTVEVGGAPGRMWIDEKNIGWVADQMEGQVLKFDVTTGKVLDPLVLCPSQGDNNFVSDVGTDGGGNLYATCFATDTLYWLTPGATGPQAVQVGDGPVGLLVMQR